MQTLTRLLTAIQTRQRRASDERTTGKEETLQSAADGTVDGGIRMTDYISREYVLKCLDDSYKNAGITAEAKAKVMRWLKKAPAADVRPVVMCRDCKNNYNTCLNHGINEPMCDFTDRKLREDDFCSRGEKREES